MLENAFLIADIDTFRSMLKPLILRRTRQLLLMFCGADKHQRTSAGKSTSYKNVGRFAGPWLTTRTYSVDENHVKAKTPAPGN